MDAKEQIRQLTARLHDLEYDRSAMVWGEDDEAIYANQDERTRIEREIDDLAQYL